MRFLQYYDYISIVTLTNDLFDYWFFKKKLDYNSKIFSTKKNINKLPIQKQTENIILILKSQGAKEDLIDIFKKRKELEDSIFENKEKDQKYLKELIMSLKENCKSYH